jgi:hypothetical protein
MTTAFGPQGPNFSTTRPGPAPDQSGGVDTWFIDCSAAGVYDGTLMYAEFFNVMIGNLRAAVRGSGITLTNANDGMLYEAIQAIATSIARSSIEGGAGIDFDEGVIRLDHGLGNLPTLTHNAVAPAEDTLVMWDESESLHKEVTAYELIRSVLGSATGVVFGDVSGQISFSAPRFFTSESQPVGGNVGDYWYDPTDDTLAQYVNDGARSVWVENT